MKGIEFFKSKSYVGRHIRAIASRNARSGMVRTPVFLDRVSRKSVVAEGNPEKIDGLRSTEWKSGPDHFSRDVVQTSESRRREFQQLMSVDPGFVKVIDNIPSADMGVLFGIDGGILKDFELMPGIKTITANQEDGEIVIHGFSKAAAVAVEARIKAVLTDLNKDIVRVVSDVPKSYRNAILRSCMSSIEQSVRVVYDFDSSSFVIRGSDLAAVEAAEDKILDLATELDKRVCHVIRNIPASSIGSIFRDGGEVIREMQRLPGIRAVVIRRDVGEVRIEGTSQEAVAQVKARIKELISDTNTKTRKSVIRNIPFSCFRSLFGKNGDTVNHMQKIPGIQYVKLDPVNRELSIEGDCSAVEEVETELKRLISQTISKGVIRVVKNLPPNSAGFIMGVGGENIQALQRLPDVWAVDFNSDSGDVLIHGANDAAVQAVESRIDDILVAVDQRESNKVVKVISGLKKWTFGALYGVDGATLFSLRKHPGIQHVEIDRDAQEVVIQGDSEEAVQEVVQRINQIVELPMHNRVVKVMRGISSISFSKILGNHAQALKDMNSFAGIQDILVERDDGEIIIQGNAEAVAKVEAKINQLINARTWGDPPDLGLYSLDMHPASPVVLTRIGGVKYPIAYTSSVRGVGDSSKYSVLAESNGKKVVVQPPPTHSKKTTTTTTSSTSSKKRSETVAIGSSRSQLVSSVTTIMKNLLSSHIMLTTNTTRDEKNCVPRILFHLECGKSLFFSAPEWTQQPTSVHEFASNIGLGIKTKSRFVPQLQLNFEKIRKLEALLNDNNFKPKETTKHSDIHVADSAGEEHFDIRFMLKKGSESEGEVHVECLRDIHKHLVHTELRNRTELDVRCIINSGVVVDAPTLSHRVQSVIKGEKLKITGFKDLPPIPPGIVVSSRNQYVQRGFSCGGVVDLNFSRLFGRTLEGKLVTDCYQVTTSCDDRHVNELIKRLGAGENVQSELVDSFMEVVDVSNRLWQPLSKILSE